MGLKKYQLKRDFRRTKEPHGGKAKLTETHALYVIQKHAASHLHYDFRLELEGVLLSWAVPKGPSLDPKVKHLAIHVEDHPVEYANFEGTIPEGEYGAGTVMVWDIGKWQPLDANVRQAYDQGNLTFNLYGKKLHGRWKLIKVKRLSENKDQWLLFKVNDEYSRSEQDYDVKKSEPYSALTDRSLAQIKNENKHVWTEKGRISSEPIKAKRLSLKLNRLADVRKLVMPMKITPELASVVTEPPKGDKWLHEIKWDGYRLITKIYHNEVQLLTRRHNDWTYQFPSIMQALKSLKLKECIFDGELIALDKDRRANFQILQNALENRSFDVNMVYYIFDLLYYDGYSLVDVPLIKRKDILNKILQSKELPNEIKFNDHIIGNGQAVYQQACEYSLEGIVSKRTDSRYVEKRTKDWLKIKCTHRQEFVIGGFTDPKSSRLYFGALMLGYYKHAALIYCGRVGTGFNQESLKTIANELKKYHQDSCPFESIPGGIAKNMHWVKPKLVAEIEFLEITDDGILRQPSFKGLREDKNPREVTLELPYDATKIKMRGRQAKRASTKTSIKNEFTNMDRVLYPEQGLTKRDLITYYESVADWMLPYVVHRPLTLMRCPSGVHEDCFYQKRISETVPSAIENVNVLEHGKYEPYITISELDGLLGLVQMGTLEIHPWGSRNENIEKPDWVIFDLDPAPNTMWDLVVECAYLMREFLNFLNLKCFLKTTGGKGLHVVIPIKPNLSWNEVRNITKRIADVMVAIHPDKYIATMSKVKRSEKIFIDYLRNSRGATAIAPYSTRATAHASVAVPIAWEELSEGIKSDTFNVTNINRRLKHLSVDPWKDFFNTKQTITTNLQKKLWGKF
jgi:bifunctional non-homologous end joining protein LigD